MRIAATRRPSRREPHDEARHTAYGEHDATERSRAAGDGDREPGDQPGRRDRRSGNAFEHDRHYRARAMADEVLSGVWRDVALHPEWTEDEGGEDGWEREVAWYAVASSDGLVLIDPLVSDWNALDRLVSAQGGCAGIVRTCHWHQRSIPEAASRYGGPSVGSAGDVERHRPPVRSRASPTARSCSGSGSSTSSASTRSGCGCRCTGALIFGDAMLRHGARHAAHVSSVLDAAERRSRATARASHGPDRPARRARARLAWTARARRRALVAEGCRRRGLISAADRPIGPAFRTRCSHAAARMRPVGPARDGSG